MQGEQKILLSEIILSTIFFLMKIIIIKTNKWVLREREENLQFYKKILEILLLLKKEIM